MFRFHRISCLLSVALVVTCGGLRAGVNYDAETDTIIVNDYPADMPSSLDRLCKIDALYKWGKVAHDPATDTYTLSARLVIGSNDGSDTHMRIGSAERPNERLIIKNEIRKKTNPTRYLRWSEQWTTR